MEDRADKTRLSEEYCSGDDNATSTPHPCQQAEFDRLYQYNKPHKPGLRKRIAQSKQCQPKKALVSLFPILSWLPRYNWKTDLMHDIVSGFTVAIMHIPQGMAYALLGGVSPVVGIYMAFFPVLLYVTMGTSRHVSMGTFAVVCMMTSKSVLLYSNRDTGSQLNTTAVQSDSNQTQETSYSPSYTPEQVASVVCFVAGIWQLLLGSLRLGALSVLLSDTLVSGFTTGAATHVVTSQIKNLLGIKVPHRIGPLKIIWTYVDIFNNIHTANLTAVIISAITVFILASYNELIKPRVSKKLPMPIPVELIAVIIGTVVSMFANLKDKFDITVVGEIPTGLPAPSPPPFALVPNVLVDGLVIAIVASSINMSMAYIFARKLNYSINANQELIASGVSNIFASFFSCIPFAASLSRSLIQQTVGGRTQLASVVSCMLLLLVLLVIGPFFEPLPNCVLASIVLVALKGMFMQVKELPAMWRQSTLDGMIWLVTFLSVVLLDIDIGLGLGVALSLACVLLMGQRPKVCLLGNVPGTDIYLDTLCYQAAQEVPGMKIVQVAGGLHFANKEHVKQKLYKLVNDDPSAGTESSKPKKNIEKDPAITIDGTPPLLPKHANENSDNPHVTSKIPVYCVVLDMMSVCFIDPSSVKTLLTIYKDLKTKTIMFCLADVSAVYANMERCDFFKDFPDSQVFPSVHDAVLFAQQSHNS